MEIPKCALCKTKPCTEGITDEKFLPNFCPIKNHKHLIPDIIEKYKSKNINNFYINSVLTEKKAYNLSALKEGKTIPVSPRIKEITTFAKRINAEKLGIAFCSGLSDEAERASSILEGHGFQICSAVCTCGAIDKSALDIPSHYRLKKENDFEAACNPLLQAEVLNVSETDFNIIIGLCVGHDMLFTQNSKAPVTTLIVKDRFTGHNPVISLYTQYHKNIR
ncbi:MAG: DUF1847 domain-containing protein [Candidatus Aminicenantaceae bacterium]